MGIKQTKGTCLSHEITLDPMFSGLSGRHGMYMAIIQIYDLCPQHDSRHGPTHRSLRRNGTYPTVAWLSYRHSICVQDMALHSQGHPCYDRGKDSRWVSNVYYSAWIDYTWTMTYA